MAAKVEWHPGELYHCRQLGGDISEISGYMISLLFNSLAVETYQLLCARGLGGKDIVEEVNFMATAAATDIYDPRPHKADHGDAETTPPLGSTGDPDRVDARLSRW